ncbi:protein-export chaperone SecB [Paralimibaculum aggregatum]|uniref:Protein-export protein SecB n=1 Tax=Paralimibaculum aggregatum TaxID=3036245 RepID=A0ABQ6LPW9_9RHOB|nr:protein-export chaperone SecB [Limibaculum sp. NKW23]GMG83443.1 protein-export chaperone SecB [Limibaculum sp. NKW23]
MTDTTSQTPGGIDLNNPPIARMLAHFTRDLSFENVAVMEGQQVKGNPEIQVNVGMDAKSLGDDRYQVNMKINAKATGEDKTRFLVELDYAGLFTLSNVKKEHLHPFLFIECPRQLLPFARRVLADVTRDGGYPPLMIDNVDFATLYRQRLEAARQQKAEGDAAAAPQV